MIPPLWRWKTCGKVYFGSMICNGPLSEAFCRKRRGPRRVDDRRVISGIIHVLQSGMRRRDCPEESGPPTTIYNRWHRWSQQGLCQRMFKELSQIVGTHYENAIDSTAVKVHRSARGKRGPRPGSRHTSRRMHDQSPRGDRPQRPPFALSPERRPMRRWQRRRAFAEALAAAKETVG